MFCVYIQFCFCPFNRIQNNTRLYRDRGRNISKSQAKSKGKVEMVTTSESDSGEEYNIKRDFDPEDADFGSHSDRTTAANILSRSRKLQEGSNDTSRAHYKLTAAAAASSGGGKKKKVALPIDDDDYMGGKYAGVKASRADLGFDISTDEDDEMYSDLDDEESDYNSSEEESEYNSSEGSDYNSEEEELENDSSKKSNNNNKKRLYEQMEAFKEEEDMQLQMVARKATDDSKRGVAVKEQLNKWQAALDVRIKLQPLMTLAQKIPSSMVMSIFNEDEKCKEICSEVEGEVRMLQEELARHLGDICGVDSKDLSEIDSRVDTLWRDSLDKWHQKTILAVEGSGRKQLKIINQSLYAQVQSSLRDKERLIKRTRTRRTNIQPIIGGIEDSLVFDDGDFFSLLVRDWVDVWNNSGSNSAATAGLVVRAMKVPGEGQRDGRMSKGRKIRYDVQDKLVNYMVPQPVANLWPDDKIDAFITSIFPVTNVS